VKPTVFGRVGSKNSSHKVLQARIVLTGCCVERVIELTSLNCRPEWTHFGALAPRAESLKNFR